MRFVVPLLVLLQSGFIALLLIHRARRLQSEARCEAILRAVPDLMFLQTLDGVYVDYNSSDPTRLLSPPEQFLGKNMRDVLPAELLRQVEAAFAQVAGSAATTEPVVVDYKLDMPDGHRWYEARLVRTSKSQVLTLVRDVTEHKRVETALREGAYRYALASAAGSVGVWDWNFEADELFVDPALKRILGFEDTEITTKVDDWGSRIHPDDLPMAAASVKACIDGDSDVYEVDHRMVHKDGSVRWFLSRGSAIRAADGTLRRLVGTKVDITARRRAEDAVHENEAALRASTREVRHLAGTLISAQDGERSRMARELHDDVSQQVAALSIALSSLKRRVAAAALDPSLEASVVSLQRRAIAVAESIRGISHDLHPDVLKHGGLPDALTAHCADISSDQVTAVVCRAEGAFESIDPKVALSLYRIAQEALHNVVKHANARRAEVRLRRIVDGVELAIVDDGQGFDVVAARHSETGLGLVSINERVRLAGGTVSIVSELRHGTQVHVRVPLVLPTGLADAAT